ncbi:MAG: 3-keto-5-aminohexanoate cleavage protein [Candidatus Binatia bacterium]
MTKRKLVIIAAVNGGAQQDREGAYVPITPVEIAAEALKCFEAGASVLHIHARDANKQATGDVKIFSEIIRRTRDKCEILIQTTNGIGMRRDPTTGRFIFPMDDERLGLLTIEPKQDLFSLAGGSWDFYHPEGGHPGPSSFVTTEELLRKNIPAVLETGAAIELEIVDIGFLQKLRRLAEDGVFDPNSKRVWLQLSFGAGGMPPTPRMLINARDEAQRLFPALKWEVLGVGREQFQMNSMGVLMDCDIVRVGFEDNIYLPNGKPAQHNHQLVEAMARIGREFGREPATVGEARTVLGLGS